MLPQYEKTLAVYEYLRANTAEDGTVHRSRRQIARDMGYRSWSSITFHLQHLERAGLIARNHSGPLKQRIIYIPSLERRLTKEEAIAQIAHVPRTPWAKYKEGRPSYGEISSILDLLSQLRAKRKVVADDLARIDADIEAVERTVELHRNL